MEIKVYLDEDVHAFIAEALHLRGWEALTTREAGRRGASDLDQIEFATKHGYAILTYNVSNFPRHHFELTARGRIHSGIIIATQDDPRRSLRALLNILSTFSQEDVVGQLIYLNNWE